MLDQIMTGVNAFLTSYRDKLQGELAGFAERLSDLSSYPFIVTPAHRLHWIYLFSFLVVALVVYLRQKPAGQDFTLKSFLGFWLPKSIYRHRSTLLDLKFYVVNGVFVEAAFVSALIGSFYLFADAFEAALLLLWSAPAAPFEVTLPIRVAYVSAIFLAASTHDEATGQSHRLDACAYGPPPPASAEPPPGQKHRVGGANGQTDASPHTTSGV